MKKIILLAVILSLNVLASEGQKEERAPIITASQLAELVRQQGADNVISTLSGTDGDGGEWKYVMDKISSGNSEWLNVVPLLADTGPEGMSIDISRAVALALINNTEGVLSIINDHFIPISTRDVCSMPFNNKTRPERNAYVVNAIQVLYKSNSVQAQKCLQQLIKTVGQSDPSWEGY